MTIRFQPSFAIAGVTTIWALPAIASDQPYQPQLESPPESFIEFNHSLEANYTVPAADHLVDHLSDVKPDDWAAQALQSLTERYQCLEGYPDSTYQGDRTLTRYEFAAALFACLERLNQQIADATLDLADTDDLATLQRLQTDFAPELIDLQPEVARLETRTDALEAQQFSPTTTLNGEAIFALAGVGGDRKADGSGESVEETVIGGYRLRLELETSFSGDDRLRMRLQSRDIAELEEATGTPMANLGFDGSTDGNFELDRLDYATEIGDRTEMVLSLEGGGLGDYVSTVNPLFSDSESGAISAFARENPIRRQGSVPGIGIAYELTDNLELEAGYIARGLLDPEVGFAQSPYSAIAQVTFEPTDTARLSVTYVRSFNSLDTGTGSRLASDPFEGESDAIMANSLGAEVSFDVSPALTIGGRVGFMQATAKDLDGNPQADIFTWAVLLGLPDLGGEGNLLGVVVGQPPRVTRNDTGDSDPDAALHLEAFYRLQLSDDIAITPGAFVVFNPENNASNDPIYIATIRTTFSF